MYGCVSGCGHDVSVQLGGRLGGVRVRRVSWDGRGLHGGEGVRGVMGGGGGEGDWWVGVVEGRHVAISDGDAADG